METTGMGKSGAHFLFTAESHHVIWNDGHPLMKTYTATGTTHCLLSTACPLRSTSVLHCPDARPVNITKSVNQLTQKLKCTHAPSAPLHLRISWPHKTIKMCTHFTSSRKVPMAPERRNTLCATSKQGAPNPWETLPWQPPTQALVRMFPNRHLMVPPREVVVRGESGTRYVGSPAGCKNRKKGRTI